MNLDILQVIDDPALFGPWFKNKRTWRAWRAFLAALFALPMSRREASIYRTCTKRENLPIEPASEGWLVVGRRGGKSFISALIAVFLACFRDWTPYLAPGERGTVMLVAADRKQARTLKRYISALLNEVPLLKPMLVKETEEVIELNNRINIEIHTCSFRSVRGYTIVAAIGDEIAFWRTEDSAEPDTEVINAIRPGMATVPGAILLAISSPYSKKGALHSTYKRYFGQDGPVLVWQADTQTMNPSVPDRVIEQAYEADPVAAKAEYGAQFRDDIAAFVDRETVESCVHGRKEIPPIPGAKYFAFVDPSGGRGDSMTLAIGHKEEKRRVIDAVREVKPPFSPDAVVKDFAKLLKRYRIRSVTGDRYAGEWPVERFKVRGITYRAAPKPKSDLYRDFLPLLNSGEVELPYDTKLINQICSLERRTARGGKDSIDHPPNGHDDIANAVAGAAVLMDYRKKRVGVWPSVLSEGFSKGRNPNFRKMFPGANSLEDIHIGDEINIFD